jgi:hypothetical protein
MREHSPPNDSTPVVLGFDAVAENYEEFVPLLCLLPYTRSAPQEKAASESYEHVLCPVGRRYKFL